MTSAEARLRVMVADDSLTVASRMMELLEETGVVELVGRAADGPAALLLFERTAPHAVVLDLSMPGLDGLQVLRAIRGSDPDCFVIVLTGHTENSLHQACRDAGANHVLVKAADFEQIPQLVRDYAARRRL